MISKLLTVIGDNTTVFTPGTNNIIYCSFGFCAIVINLLLIFNYIFTKKLKNLSSVLYSALLVISLFAAVFNVVAILLSAVVVGIGTASRVFELLFYFAFLSSGVVFYAYTAAIIYGDIKKIPVQCKIAAGLFVGFTIAGVTIASLAFFSDVGVNKYVYKWTVYGSLLLFTATAFALAMSSKKDMTNSQIANICVYTGLMVVSSVLQATFRQAEICTFCLSLALVLTYISLQHPETEVDQVSGMLNLQSYVFRTNEKLSSGKTFKAFAFELGNMALVNTTFGIVGGNEVIKEVASRTKELLPKSCALYRLAGARFVINFFKEEELKNFSDNFFTIFERPYAVGSTEIKMDVTACIVEMPTITDKVADIQEILKYYRTGAKTSSSIFVADAGAVTYSRRREHVEYAISNALKNRSFKVYYQPIYSIEKKCINCCEALIRLKDPDLGFISPDEFIPIAEETGRIVEVGKFVMEEVCRFIRDSEPQKYGIEFIDVNLSVIQFMSPEIIDDITSVLKDYGVPRSMVNLEITETASAKSYSVLQSRLLELHSSGFTISLDDFGTGFSSVEYLIKFPFDVVKLDKSIVWAYMSTDKYEPILRHYMPMLHALGMKIVAEGVETEEMLSALEELGCDYIQGFYFSKPIPEKEFLEYVKRYSSTIRTA